MTPEIYKDEFQTPPEVAKYMVSLIPVAAKTILEPTPGNGQIVRELAGYLVTAPSDFFMLDKAAKFDAVVMNPPFSRKYTNMDNAPIDYTQKGMKVGYQILKDCLQKSNHIIALLPWFTLLDSDVRFRQIKDFGLKSITSLPRKTFKYARIQTAVYELERGYLGDTTLKLFDQIKQRQYATAKQLFINI